MSRAPMLLATACVVALSGATRGRSLGAQSAETTVRVIVRDSAGRAVPFALVQPHNRTERVTRDSGVVEFRLEAKDSLRFVVRRLGFAPHDGYVARQDGTNDYLVRLLPIAQSLKASRIIANSNELLEQRGFYDRMERARAGAFTARFVTPEELDLRNPARISQMMQGTPFVKVKLDQGRAMILGRSMNCPMTILLDGHRVSGLMEEFFTDEGQREVEGLMPMVRGPDRYANATALFLKGRQSIDEFVTAHSIVAIEMYGSMANAPVELIRMSNPKACGIIALWTGARR